MKNALFGLCFVGLLMPALAQARQTDPRLELLAEEKARIALFQRASKSVVYITSMAARRDIFGFSVETLPQGTGSGFIWDDKGHIVTNFHVIQNASGAEVTLDNQKSYPAKLIGVEPDKDIAVLQIDTKAPLNPIPLGTSADLAVGQSVLAIGNPFGLDQTLTLGIISALGREIKSANGRPIQGVIQTDAVINPGNSGGPLLDTSGRLIGMNTAILSPTGTSVGIGFAVPVDTVNRIVEQLIKHGKVVHPALGAQFLDDSQARRLGIRGLLILTVGRNSGAARAGLQPTKRDTIGRVKLGDILIAVDGKTVNSASDLYKLLDDKKVGDKVEVTFLRGDTKQTATVTLTTEVD